MSLTKIKDTILFPYFVKNTLLWPKTLQWHITIKIMFLQRHKHQRNYKYSHPLAGTLYNNQNFLMHCQAYLDTDLKLSTSTTTTEEQDIKTSSQKRTSQGFHT